MPEKALYKKEILLPLGSALLLSDGEKLKGLWLIGQKHFGGHFSNLSGIPAEETLPVFLKTETFLARYFAGEPVSPDGIPLAPDGTPFQKLVWKELLRIPYGETKSYGSLAREVAAALHRSSMSAQAVGSAVGRNPISILIPCHRVVGAGGNLTGYAGGLDKKEALLHLEGAWPRHSM